MRFKVLGRISYASLSKQKRCDILTSMELAVEERKKFGKAGKTLRGEGLIPAELYGHGLQNMHLAVKTKEFSKVFKEAGENIIVNLMFGKEKLPALIHDIQRHYVTDEIIHIDFYQVRMDEKITTHIPIEFTGDAPAVKEQGGFLNKTLTEIEVEALPADLPHGFTLDLGSLNELNKSLYVKDISVPSGVKVLLDPEAVVVTVIPPVKEEEKVEVPVDVTAVKVESEEKKAERAAEKSKEEKE